jgi:hypothetical protein
MICVGSCRRIPSSESICKKFAARERARGRLVALALRLTTVGGASAEPSPRFFQVACLLL